MLRNDSINSEGDISSFCARTLARELPLPLCPEDEIQPLRNYVISRLKSEQKGPSDILLGKKHIDEMVDIKVVAEVEMLLDEEMEEICDDVTDFILARCLIEATHACYSVYE